MIERREVYSRPSGSIVSPLKGQLVPMKVTLSPRDVWISRPEVLKGPYGQPEEEETVESLDPARATNCGCASYEGRAEDETLSVVMAQVRRPIEREVNARIV